MLDLPVVSSLCVRPKTGRGMFTQRSPTTLGHGGFGGTHKMLAFPRSCRIWHLWQAALMPSRCQHVAVSMCTLPKPILEEGEVDVATFGNQKHASSLLLARNERKSIPSIEHENEHLDATRSSFCSTHHHSES